MSETIEESPKEYVCNYCERSFTKKYAIRRHIRNCHDTTNCFCHICEQNFYSPTGLRKHLSRGHNRFKQGNPECDLCGKIFTRRESIVPHLWTRHSIGKKPFDKPCNVCNKKFSNQKNLKAHIRKLHDPKFEHPTCDECNKVLRNKESLVAHFQVAHKVSAKDIHRCRLCEKVYCSKNNLKQHEVTFHGVNDEHKCDVCAKTFGSNISLRRHVKTEHNIELPKEFTCEHCSKVFTEQQLLDSHISLHHKLDGVSPQKYNCECGKVFDSEPVLRQHIKSDHDFEVFYSYCKNSLLRTVPLGAEKAKTSSSGHDCEVCQDNFESLYDLRNHMKANHDIQLSLETCNVCFAKFYSKEAMAQHQKACVAPNNSMQCRQCDKLLTARSSLNLHMKVFHPKPESPVPSEYVPPQNPEQEDETSNEVKCKYCDMVFKSKWTVQQHVEYVHLGMQRFKCIECGSHFKERRNLRKHVRIKHPHSSTFPQCHYCRKRFESAKACQMHLKQVHSFDTKTFPCEICSESFTKNDSLALHVKVKHKDEDDVFKCENCSILFKGFETFDKHKQKCEENVVSVPENVPRCVVCMKDFCTEKSLKRHIKRFHEGLDPNEMTAIGFSKRIFTVDCKDCLDRFTDDDLYQNYLKNKHISEAIIFKCPTCADTYNVIEFAIQRYKKTMKVRKRKQAIIDSDDEDSERQSTVNKPGCSKKRSRK